MKNNCIFHREKWHRFAFFQISLMDDLIKEHNSHICFFIYNLLGYVVLTEGYEENTASHRYVAGKGGPKRPLESVLGTSKGPRTTL